MVARFEVQELRQASSRGDESHYVRPRLSLNQITTYRWSLLDDVAAYCDAGIEGIGLWRPKLAEYGEERSLELLRDSGLAVSSISWAGGFTGSNGHSFQAAIDDARDAIRLAGELRAESLVIVSGARAGHTGKHARRLLIDALRELGDEAARHNVLLGLQPMHEMFSHEWTFLTKLDDALDVLQAVDHPAVGLAFDVYHLWQEPGLLERIPEIVPRVTTLQLSDWRDPPRSENDRCLPGDGCIPLGPIVQQFLRHGYRGFFEIEIWSEELWSSHYGALVEECQSRFRTLLADESARSANF